MSNYISNGTDVALWQDDPGNQPTGTVMVQWVSPDQRDSIYAGDIDHSYDTAAFDNGSRRNQFVASMDFITHY